MLSLWSLPALEAGWFAGSAARAEAPGCRVQPGPVRAAQGSPARGPRAPGAREAEPPGGGRRAGGRWEARLRSAVFTWLAGSPEAGEERRARPALGAAARLRRRASGTSLRPRRPRPRPRRTAPGPRTLALGARAAGRAARTRGARGHWRDDRHAVVTSPGAGGCLCLRPRAGTRNGARGFPGGRAGGGRCGTRAATLRG